MSRPNGPVRGQAMPTQPEHARDPQGAQSADHDHGAYAGQQPNHSGHAPVGNPRSEQRYSPPESNAYGQNRYGQPHHDPLQAGHNASGHYSNGQFSDGQYSHSQGQPSAPYQDPARQDQPLSGQQSYANTSHAGASWADVNQPQPHTRAQGYGSDPSAYASQQTPSYSAEAPAYEPAPTQHAPHAHYQQQSPTVQPTTPTAAPSGYDFGGYDAPLAQPQLDSGVQPHQEPAVDWGQANFAPVANSLGQPSAELGYATQSTELQTTGHNATQQPDHLDETYAGEDDFEYEDDEDTGRGRGFIVAAALAGAVVIGGGVAYGYQTIFGSSSSGQPPVVRGASGPAKVKPADPGGRKFAHTNSKIMGRLGSASGKSNDPSGGARRVSTLRIGRDGSVISPANPQAGGTGNRMVSGLTLGGTPVASATGANANAAPQVKASKEPIVVNPPAAKKQTANNPPVKVVAAKPVPPKATKPESNPAKSVEPAAKPKPKPAAAPKKVAAAKPAPAAPVGPKPTGAGYVAVLASVPASKTSRMDALKQFADMQQKYGAALVNKTPDVQRANLGAKGTYHRLIAGPPGSAQSARQVCTSLKEAGYPSCWVLAY